MIVTKEQQEKLVAAYSTPERTTKEILGFIDGMDSAIQLMIRIDHANKQNIKSWEQSKN